MSSDYCYGSNSKPSWNTLHPDSPTNAPGWFLLKSAQACSWKYSCFDNDAPNNRNAPPNYNPPPDSIDQPCHGAGECLDILAQVAMMACTLSTDGACGLASTAGKRLGTGAIKLFEGVFGGSKAADSVWGMNWAARGVAIENKLGHNLPSAFPTIDPFANGTATSIKGIDLTVSTYQSASRLSGKLRGYVNSVAGFNGASFDGVTITVGAIKSRALDIAIPQGMATQGRSNVLSQIIAYGQSIGVDVNVVEIP